ncbi:MAG TPA: RNA-binding cell elongation regulator Jag/EloR [Candidatus Limiplasma sp.]|nr:RNA-binding cell elongation regulator Jag/EloR [Candidatus Limiplasma sp.]HRX08427.1 RNA-binding cell elongation regulator Jag/EloR [Candidatus Limiplasma sp.]
MRSIESSAKTIEDAIRQGLEKLDVSLGDVTIDIIQEGSKGLFGIMGTKEAKVRLTVKDDGLDDDILSTLAPQTAPAAQETPVSAPRKPKKQKKRSQPKTSEPVVKSVEATVEKPADKLAKQQKPKVEITDTPKEPLKQYAKADPDTAAGVAQEFLVNVTKLMNLDVSVESGTDEEGNVRVNIHGDTLGILIGRRGETLDALQYLTSLNVNHGKDDYTRVTLDTENYRAKREEALKRLANRMANRAVKTGRKVVLEPMNPYERRILHSALQQNSAVTTHSEGDEPNRHVVISLKS